MFIGKLENEFLDMRKGHLIMVSISIKPKIRAWMAIVIAIGLEILIIARVF